MGLAEGKLGFELGDDQRLGFPVNYLSRLTEALPKAQNKRRHRRVDRNAPYQKPARDRIHAQGL